MPLICAEGPILTTHLLQECRRSNAKNDTRVVKTWSRRSTSIPRTWSATRSQSPTCRKHLPVYVTGNSFGPPARRVRTYAATFKFPTACQSE